MGRSIPIGIGSYLPERVVTNEELAKTVETSDEWIRQRTGIAQRHIAAEGELTSHLALEACQQALEAADLDANDIDLIVLATSTPDETFPATATRVQAELGMTHGAAFDVQAVCSGFIYALSVADNLLKGGHGKRALVVGAETFSRILDWDDRGTCVLFGDGAGAMVLEFDDVAAGKDGRGILSTPLYSDGRHHDALYVDGGVSTTGESGHLRMEGKEVFRHAVVKMADAIDTALQKNDLTYSDIKWMIPHQANIRIIESMAKRMNLPMEQVVVTVDRHANTSAASIPLALAEAVHDGRIQRCDLLMLEAMGGGFTWGSAVLRW